jgi:ABC-type multidrug transport system ATPase subunit
MIQTMGLTKRYGKFTAVDGVNLNIPAGQIYGFLGPNGAGKTSTIMMLLGILKPTAGSIRLFGEEYHPGRLDLRKRIGVVPEKQPLGMWSWMTAEEYLFLFADLFQVPDPGERIGALLEKVGLSDVRRKRISEFSHGMMQKLSIIRALLPDPDILFLDEPISGLDPFGVKQTRDLILEENREGRTIFISSHILSEVEKICHRVAIIFQGRLLAEDQMGSLLGGLTKEREIHVDLESLPEDLPGAVRGLPFVREAAGAGNTLVVKVPKKGDYRKDLSAFLIGRGLVPLAIQEKSLSLEEAFVTITQENVQLLAGMGAGSGGRS